MKVVVAIDSFKGSISSLQAGEAAKRGILAAKPDATVLKDGDFDACFSILREVSTLEEAMKPDNAQANLAATAEQVFRLL